VKQGDGYRGEAAEGVEARPTDHSAGQLPTNTAAGAANQVNQGPRTTAAAYKPLARLPCQPTNKASTQGNNRPGKPSGKLEGLRQTVGSPGQRHKAVNNLKQLRARVRAASSRATGPGNRATGPGSRQQSPGKDPGNKGLTLCLKD
jgi:hypothetical protein